MEGGSGSDGLRIIITVIQYGWHTLFIGPRDPTDKQFS